VIVVGADDALIATMHRHRGEFSTTTG